MGSGVSKNTSDSIHSWQISQTSEHSIGQDPLPHPSSFKKSASVRLRTSNSGINGTLKHNLSVSEETVVSLFGSLYKLKSTGSLEEICNDTKQRIFLVTALDEDNLVVSKGLTRKVTINPPLSLHKIQEEPQWESLANSNHLSALSHDRSNTSVVSFADTSTPPYGDNHQHLGDTYVMLGAAIATLERPKIGTVHQTFDSDNYLLHGPEGGVFTSQKASLCRDSSFTDPSKVETLKPLKKALTVNGTRKVFAEKVAHGGSKLKELDPRDKNEEFTASGQLLSLVRAISLPSQHLGAV